jgi:periplasmic protein TonB
MSMRVPDFAEDGIARGLRHEAVAPPLPTLAVDEAAPPSRAIWLVAALGAVAIHAGCVALAYGYLRSDDGDDELGAPAIAIGVELEAPQRDPSNVAPGPDSDASTASPDVMEHKTAVEETDLPKATTTETDDPDRVVASKEPKKAEDDAPDTPTVQAAPSTPSAAAEAAAMPSPQTATQAPRSTAPDQGTAESLRRVRTTWQKELVAHLEKNKRYPGNPGNRPPPSVEIVLRIVLDRSGHVVSAEITKSSGDSAFDGAALDMMRRSDPVPAPPPVVADEGLVFTVPVLFKGRG